MGARQRALCDGAAQARMRKADVRARCMHLEAPRARSRPSGSAHAQRQRGRPTGVGAASTHIGVHLTCGGCLGRGAARRRAVKAEPYTSVRTWETPHVCLQASPPIPDSTRRAPDRRARSRVSWPCVGRRCAGWRWRCWQAVWAPPMAAGSPGARELRRSARHVHCQH
jgi:hypothetical protein